MTKSTKPKIISYNKHESEIGALTMTISMLENENKELTTSLSELKVEIKAKLDMITRLHDEIDKHKTSIIFHERSIEGYKNQVAILEARKWYQVFTKNK